MVILFSLRNVSQNVYEKIHQFGYSEIVKKKYVCMLYKECHSSSFHIVKCQPNAVTHNKYDCQKSKCQFC